MQASPNCEHIVDVREELVTFTLLTRSHRDALLDRYSERTASTADGRP